VLLAIAFGDGRIALLALPPVIRIPDPPLADAVLADFAVLRVGGDLAVVAIGAPPPLTVGFAADRLTRLNFDGWKTRSQ
jgi:hypothetical protein